MTAMSIFQGSTNTKRRALGVFLGVLVLGISFCAVQAGAKGIPRVMFIFDASGSMGQDAGGQTRIDAAKQVISRIVAELPLEVKVGLAAYGHRRKKDCSDIEVLIPPQSSDRSALLAKVKRLIPVGQTPIANSIKQVVQGLKGVQEETTVVLISDGEETCHPDPCGLVKSLKKSGLPFVLDVVGFAVNEQQKRQLACLAEAGGGRYYGAADAGALLAALERVKGEVEQKVAKAKTRVHKVRTGLGKLRITMPASATVCLNTIRIIRASDGKLVRTIRKLKADSRHLLPPGSYKVEAGYANSNYQPDSVVPYGVFEIRPGETTPLRLGALAINIADSLRKIPAGAVIITKKGEHGFTLITPYTGNSYYFYKTKPLPRGIYDFAVHYKETYLYRTKDQPVVLAENIQVEEGKETVITIDTGIQLVKPTDGSVTAWELIPAGGTKPLLHIVWASNGDYPIWKPYAVMPGSYRMVVYLEGMNEALPLGEVEIRKGELVKFDLGL